MHNTICFIIQYLNTTGVNLYTFGVALAPPPNAEFGPLNIAFGPLQCFYQICALQQYLYPCMLEILAFSGFVLRHTLISMFVKFFLDLVTVHDYMIT